MSATPKISVLSSKQLNKTLSAKKKPLKTLKNILSSKSLDWPVLENTNTLFEELLTLGLNRVKDGQPIRSNKAEMRKSILFGVNQIGRSINKDECSAVLFDAETPRMLISHLIQMALANNIPISLVPGLRNFLLDNLGFRCSAVSFKTGIDEYAKLLSIIQLKVNNCQASGPVGVTEQACKQQSSNEVPCQESSIIYLKRPSDGQRAFNPPLSNKAMDDTKPKVVTKMDYIKLDTESVKPLSKKNSLHPLYIKRVQNNVQRKTKKQKTT